MPDYSVMNDFIYLFIFENMHANNLNIMCFTNRCIISVLIVEQNMCGFTCQKLYLKGWISIFPLQIFKTKTVSSSETCLNGPITSLIVERWRYFLIGFWKYQGKYFCP